MALSFALTMADAHGDSNQRRKTSAVHVDYVRRRKSWLDCRRRGLAAHERRREHAVTIASSKVAKTLRVARHTSNRNLFLGKEWLADVSLGLVAKNTDGGNTWCGIADLPN